MAVSNTLGPHKKQAEIQAFLASVQGVLQATVWERQNALCAKVVVFNDTEIHGADLQQAINKKFGAASTPNFILIERITPNDHTAAA